MLVISDTCYPDMQEQNGNHHRHNACYVYTIHRAFSAVSTTLQTIPYDHDMA